MKTVKPARYKYSAGSRSSLYYSNPAVGVFLLLVGLSVWYSIKMKMLYALLGYIPVLIFWFVLSGKNNGITVAGKYVIIGDEVFFYKNMSKVEISGSKLQCHIQTANNRSGKIEAVKFKSNAQKDFKIKNNQKQKFTGVVKKMLEKMKEDAPETAVTISGFPELSKLWKRK